ncbi:MAG: deacetylase [Ruminococcaceae bacterium]|nr:deacetylase [Oscillospiraceae bacterium]
MLCKLIVYNRRRLALLGAALAAAAILAAASWTPAAVSAAAARELPIYCVERDQKLCSISFDAAWGADNTQKILDVLDEYGVKATFFVVSAWAEQYPDTAKAIVAHGHELMNHSTKHDHYSSLTAEQIVADVNKCNDVIESISGVRPTLIRCPYGEYDDHVIAAIRSIGMEPVQWDVDSLDWKGISAAEITRRVTGKVRCGSIVLFHNAGEHTPEALPDVLRWMKQEGYEIVPISQLLLSGDYTLDHEGRQHAAG